MNDSYDNTDYEPISNDIVDIFEEYSCIVDIEYLVNNTRMGY
jgi:hypothetical protein